MKTQRAYIGHGHYVDMINALSRGGHPDKIPQLLDSTTNKEWMYNDLLDEAQIFACRSESASSLCLLKYLSQMDVDKDRQNDLIRSIETSLKLIAENKLWAEAFAFIDEFKESHLSLEDCYEMLIQVTFKSKDWDGLKLVLNEISHQGMTIKPHYFYPPLAGAGVDKDVESGMEWLELMKSFGFGIDRNMMKFMLRAVDNDITKLLNILLDKGFLQAYLPDILLYFCTQGKLQDVTTLCQYITHYSEVLDVDLLLRAVNRSLVKIFYQEPGMIYSEVFKALVPMCGKEQASLLKMCVFNAVQRVTFNSQPKATIDFIRTLWNIQKDIKIAQKDTCKFVLDTFAKRQQLAEFCEFHELVNEYEVAIDCSLYKNILQVAFDLINPSMAVESFNSMKQHKCSISLRDYCNLISTLSKAKRFSQATLYFNKMRKMGYVPFPRVYTRLIIGSLSIGNLTLANNYRRFKIPYIP
jgi:pentatricopeptide repeat protein